MWSVVEISAADAEAQLEDEWNALFDSNQSYGLPTSFLWFKAWNRCFGEPHDVTVVCVRRNGQLVLIAPLVREAQDFKLLRLSSARLACNAYSPSCTMLASEGLSEEDLGRAIQTLVEHVDEPLFRIPQIADSEIEKLSSDNRLADAYALGVERVRTSPMIDVSGNWDDYFASRSKSFRKGIKRKLKKLEDRTDVVISSKRPENRDDPIFPEMFGASGRSWKAEGNLDLADDPVAQEFLLTLTDLLAPQQGVLIWEMRVDSKLIAFEYQIQFRKICYPLRADFDSDHADISPGIVLLYHTIKDLFDDKNSDLYDSCADDYDYLTSWAQSTQVFAMLDVFAQQPKPLMVHGIKYKLLPWLRQRLAS